MEPDTLVDLKSNKIQTEVGLIYLRRKHGEMQRKLAALGRDYAQRSSPRYARLASDIELVGREIADREGTIEQLARQIEHAEQQSLEHDADQLLIANEGLSAELGQLRSEILDGLKSLAEPLRQYQQLADRKTRLIRRIATLTDRDLSYPNYVDCALLRQPEFEGDLEYVIEAIKRLRVVA